MQLFVPRFFFFNDTATTEIYTLSLHDALPISSAERVLCSDSLRTSSATTRNPRPRAPARTASDSAWWDRARSEEHTSELQSRPHLVCRLLLEKKKHPHIRRAPPFDMSPWRTGS